MCQTDVDQGVFGSHMRVCLSHRLPASALSCMSAFRRTNAILQFLAALSAWHSLKTPHKVQGLSDGIPAHYKWAKLRKRDARLQDDLRHRRMRREGVTLRAREDPWHSSSRVLMSSLDDNAHHT